jgi:lipoprotein-anchoring transpeptidase ErfK/SrfK
MSFTRRSLIVSGCAAAVLTLAVTAYAYDTSRDDLVAEGVSVSGIPVGGLRADAAAEKLRHRLARRLERPVRVAVAGHRFRLTPRRVHLVVEVDTMVDQAIDRGRSGGLPARVWRGISGSNVDADVDPVVSYSTVEVGRFVRRVRRAVNRPARDADVHFQTAALPAIPSQKGLRVKARRLRAEVLAALGATGADRRVRGRVRVVKPKVTTGELAKMYPAVVTVDRANFQLRLFKRLRLAKAYRIAVGQVGLETPAGVYHVQNKAVNPAWHVPNSAWAGELAGRVIPGGVPENPLRARWLGIFDGAGIHGTADIGSLGSAASHGCIRMAIPDVEELYDQVPVGAPVYIQ